MVSHFSNDDNSSSVSFTFLPLGIFFFIKTCSCIGLARESIFSKVKTSVRFFVAWHALHLLRRTLKASALGDFWFPASTELS